MMECSRICIDPMGTQCLELVVVLRAPIDWTAAALLTSAAAITYAGALPSSTEALCLHAASALHTPANNILASSLLLPLLLLLSLLLLLLVLLLLLL